jgi:hypothetical protein
VGIAAAALVAVALILTGASAILRAQSRQLPAPTGANAVSRVELAVNDTGRIDPFATDGRTREIAVWLWYPTSDAPASTTAPYFPPAWADAADNDLGLVGVYLQDRRAVRTNSHAGAPMLDAPPVVVLMPGLSLAIPDYTALAEDLASHGYAVVGINMTGSSIVGFPDGHVVPAVAAGSVDESLATDVDAWYVDASRVIDVWVSDAAFVTSALATSPPAVGPLDFSRVAYIGHSLGGAASFERCSQDEHCVGAVDLDGTLFSDVRLTGMTAPGLVIRSEHGATGEFQRRAAADFAHVREVSRVRVLTLEGSTHSNFTDDSVLYGPVLKPVGILGSIDGHRSLSITRDVVRAFLDEVLTGAPPAALETTISTYPELTEH